MSKNKSAYVCQNCAFESAKWVGQCPSCSSWNTLVETVVKRSLPSNKGLSSFKKVETFKLSEIKSSPKERLKTDINEFDRVLGGGFVSGQVVLLAGEPGIGKSTLLLHVADKLEGKKKEVLYVSGEESSEQIKIRAERLKIKGAYMTVVSSTDADEIVSLVSSSNASLVIIDSIQTLTTQDLTGTSGSVGQVRECAFRISQAAKAKNIALILVGHVTKEGTIAGPKVLEHLVDTVLYIEGDDKHIFRILRTSKNRFGPVSEVGIFTMEEKGLIEVLNPSDIFLEERLKDSPGSCVTVIMEGYRPILLEVQALTAKTSFGYAKRTASGYNVNRLSVLVAVLEKRCGLNLSNEDIYINVAGGMKISENSADLAVCLAIYSSYSGKPLNSKLVAFGEVGLSGEIRKVTFMENRAKEARKLGFTKIIDPSAFKSVRDALRQGQTLPRV